MATDKSMTSSADIGSVSSRAGGNEPALNQTQGSRGNRAYRTRDIIRISTSLFL